MATLGFSDLRETSLPSLWDATTLTQFRLQDGRTLDQMAADVQSGLQMVNSSLLSMPHYSGMFAVQDDPDVEYPIGVSNGFQVGGEYTSPDPGRGETTGHMLPLINYDRGLGWTARYLRKARSTKLDADVRSVVIDARNLWQQKLLQRFFKMEGETVGSTSNASVPLADGGTVDSNYVPLDSPEGESFASTHDHFLRLNGITQANLNTAIETIQEHGHMSPFELIVSRVDIGSWTNTTNITGYKHPSYQSEILRDGADRANIMDNSMYVGYVETDYGICRIWATPRVPTGYWGLFKAYGSGDPRNPLRVRFDTTFGFGYNIVPGTYVNAPSHLLVASTEFGVGIGEDRTNGVCVENDTSGDYATPTIS
ncbi:MAG: hypothetical protein GY938_16590 [Ketobacter sp.]|nr:hypothetical protein [Ketobacter sp.]